MGVGDVEIVCGVEGEALRRVECGGGGGAVVAGEALSAGAGDGGDVAGGVDLADDVVRGFGEVEVAGGVEDDGGGEDEGDGESGDERFAQSAERTMRERAGGGVRSGVERGVERGGCVMLCVPMRRWPGCSLRIGWLAMRLRNLCLTLPQGFRSQATTFDTGLGGGAGWVGRLVRCM